VKCRISFNYIPLAKPNKSQAINKAKIKLNELRTTAKIASFRWGELSNLTARKIPTGETRRKTMKKKLIHQLKSINLKDGKISEK
jgi:hypothetical protein